jgi:tumor protein p53-inducible protein 3
MDFGIITPEENLTKKLLDLSNGGINLVVNCLGGSIFNDAMNALLFKGIIVNVGYMDGIDTVPINIRKIHAQRYSIHGISNAFVTKDDIIQTVEGFKRDVLPYLDKDNNKPIIDKVFHFDDIDQGRKYMMSNSQIGKIVITI